MRQPAESGDELPDLLLAPRRPERGHAGHPNAVRDDPEELSVPPRLDAGERRAGCRGLQARASLARVDAGRSVARNAMLAEEEEPGAGGLRRAGERVAHSRRMARDRPVERELGDSLLQPRGGGRSRGIDPPRAEDDPDRAGGESRKREKVGEPAHDYHSTMTVSFMLPCCAPQK